MTMRVFHVTFTREFEMSIAAESAEALHEALRRGGDWEIDEMAPPWEWAATDPLQRVRSEADCKTFPDRPIVPAAVVVGDRAAKQLVSPHEFDGDLEAELEQTIRQHKARIYEEAHQMKLPFPDNIRKDPACANP